MTLKLEDRRLDLQEGGAGGLTFEEMREIILADLQQRQGVDFESALLDVLKLVNYCHCSNSTFTIQGWSNFTFSAANCNLVSDTQ